MKFASVIGGGIIGGAIGAAIWAAISYFTNYEVGYVALGIGFIVGFFVRIGAGDWQGITPGVIAALLAIVSIAGGKYAVATIQAHDAIRNFNSVATADHLLNTDAEALVNSSDKAPEQLAWRNGKNPETVESLNDYPVDIAKKVQADWEKLPESEKASRIATHSQELAKVKDEVHQVVRDGLFKNSFGIYDLLFFGIAIYMAFQIGTGTSLKSE